MARTQRNSSHTQPAQQPANVNHTSKTAMKNTTKTKRTIDVVSDTTLIDPQQPPRPKKPRMTVKETLPESPVAPAQSPSLVRRRSSTRTKTKAPVAVQKRKRRTKAEIAADEAAAEIERQRLQELANEKRNRIVQMDLEEDISRKETEERTIRKFSDLDRAFNESSEEEFSGYDTISDSSSVVSESGENDAAGLALKRGQKASQKEGSGSKVQGSGGEKKKTGGKKEKRVAFAAASGLRSDWKTQSGGAAKAAQGKRSHVEVLSRGLEDSDIDDINIFANDTNKLDVADEQKLMKACKNATRDSSRKNELVAIASVESDSEEDFSPHVRSSLPPKPSTKKLVGKKTRVAQVKVKSEAKGPLPVLDEEVAHAKNRRFNAQNVRIEDLPDFMRPLWRKSFLPTLYDKFFASSEPFSQFFKGSDTFIALLQDIVDEVYPMTSYKVSVTDALHQLAYRRINERRSNIGATAVEIIKQHISTISGEREAREWIRWAIRTDGPLFFKKPSPPNSPSNRADPTYIPPEGRLLSRFILDLATPNLLLKKGSASENGYPMGLFALIMAALERAVCSHLTQKPTDKLQEFSNECWGSQVGLYHSSLRTIEDARWIEIFDECGIKAKEDDSENDGHQGDLSMLDNNRGFLFDFASPKKCRA